MSPDGYGGATIAGGQGTGTIIDNDASTQPLVFDGMDTPLVIADAHPKKGEKTTNSQVDVTTHDLIQSLSIEITLDDSSGMRDLGMVLTGPDPFSIVIITPVAGTSTLVLTDVNGDDPFGMWTLPITDYVKGNTHALTGWSITINDPAAMSTAFDKALLSWVEPDSSDDDELDILTQTLADDLALLLVK